MEKIKLYLDTNMMHDLFVNQAKSMREGSELVRPKKFLFLLDNQHKFDFVTSFLTKAEIMREMVSGHGVEPERVELFWSEFMNSLASAYIRGFFFDEQIVDLVAKTRMKLRTMVNFFHIFIAMKEQAYFVTGDNPALEKAIELKVYDKLLTYIGLQRLVASFPR